MGAFLVGLWAAAVGGGVALLLEARADNPAARDIQADPMIHATDMAALSALDVRLIAVDRDIPR